MTVEVCVGTVHSVLIRVNKIYCMAGSLEVNPSVLIGCFMVWILPYWRFNGKRKNTVPNNVILCKVS